MKYGVGKNGYPNGQAKHSYTNGQGKNGYPNILFRDTNSGVLIKVGSPVVRDLAPVGQGLVQGLAPVVQGLLPSDKEPNPKETSKPQPQCITFFPDGCVHHMSILDKMTIDRFVHTPYMGEDQYKVLIFQDRMKLKMYPRLKLGHDAARSLVIDNAGGNSEYSEAISMHYFEHVFMGKDFILENEVQYWREFKMVDYICTISDERIGVSVTRAMGFPHSSMFGKTDAEHLLKKKINGLIMACDLVLNKHSFTKSILHVWCQNKRIADLVKEAYEEVLEIDSMELKVLCDVAVILTICDDKDIYSNRSERKNKIIVINQ